jgi:cytochrome b561
MTIQSRATAANSADEFYDPVTRGLHWATATLIIVLWVMGRTTGWLPRGPARVDVWSVHVLLGVTLACVLVARIAWRIGPGRSLPPTDNGLLNVVAKATHYVLYALLIAVVALGITNAFAHGFPMFNLWKLPGGGDKAFTHMINGWHDLAANILVAVALLHAVAALFHHYLLKDGVLARMAPTFRRIRF